MTPKHLNALMTAPGARCPIDWNDDNLIKKILHPFNDGCHYILPKIIRLICHQGPWFDESCCGHPGLHVRDLPPARRHQGIGNTWLCGRQ